MKKFLALALSLIMVLSLVACGGSKKEETKEETKEEPAPAKEIAPETEKAEGEEERKVGFFGRLFGRK